MLRCQRSASTDVERLGVAMCKVVRVPLPRGYECCSLSALGNLRVLPERLGDVARVRVGGGLYGDLAEAL